MTLMEPGSLVHEAETQRQHIRVRVAGRLVLRAKPHDLECSLHDLSSGGVGFNAAPATLRADSHCDAELHLRLDAVTLNIPLALKIVHVDAKGRGGARFENPGVKEIAAVRRVVTACIGGEIMHVDDVMHTLGREHRVSPRIAVASPPRSLLGHLRALSLTLMLVAAGAAAFVYTALRVNERFLSTRSSVARVSGPTYQVLMPRDGVFHSLIPDSGEIAAGAPLGAFDTSLLDLVSSQLVDAGLDQKQVQQLLDTRVKGTITSPCDCRLVSMYAANEQFLNKGFVVAELAPMEFEPFVIARFRYPQAEKIEPGSAVEISIDGSARTVPGTVTQLRRGRSDSEMLDDKLVAVVKPDAPLPMAMVSRSAEVQLKRSWPSALPGFGGVVASAQAETP